MQQVPVVLDGRQGVLPRPTLVGVLLGKAAAYAAVLVDPLRIRHLTDIATLAALASAEDLRDLATATSTERARLRTALTAMSEQHPQWRGIPGASAGLLRLGRALVL